MNNIRLNLKDIFTVKIFVLLAVVFLVIIFMHLPAVKNIHDLNIKKEKIRGELSLAENIIKSKTYLKSKGRLLSSSEISLGIDEIIKSGQKNNINFISIRPKEKIKIESPLCFCMPLDLKIESTYQDFGLFLGSLKDLDQSIVRVKSFSIIRDEDILPLVISRLTLEIYLEAE
ncbi:MAG: type 4a pilus biogenesis protein PilO [Candidatus Zapsychrus exili]|nr:type 4a pilus biogenesis protein PilO [Candidatus Zapsychrus exili]